MVEDNSEREIVERVNMSRERGIKLIQQGGGSFNNTIPALMLGDQVTLENGRDVAAVPFEVHIEALAPLKGKEGEYQEILKLAYEAGQSYRIEPSELADIPETPHIIGTPGLRALMAHKIFQSPGQKQWMGDTFNAALEKNPETGEITIKDEFRDLSAVLNGNSSDLIERSPELAESLSTETGQYFCCDREVFEKQGDNLSDHHMRLALPHERANLWPERIEIQDDKAKLHWGERPSFFWEEGESRVPKESPRSRAWKRTDDLSMVLSEKGQDYMREEPDGRNTSTGSVEVTSPERGVVRSNT